jgi:molecular chaperone DnaK
MVRDAEQHAAEDARRREDVDLKNRADTAAYTAERVLRESGNVMPSDVKLEIDGLIQEIRRGLAQNDLKTVRSAMETLERAMQRAGEAAYASAGAAGRGSTSSGGGQSGPSSSVEGDYREI